jgi:hypothetical protein
MKIQLSSETLDANQNHNLRQFAEGKAPSALAKSSTFTMGRASLLKLILAAFCAAALIPPVPRLTNLNGVAIQSIDLRCDIAGCRLGAEGEAHIIRADVEAGNDFINETDHVMFRPIFVP